MAGWRRSSPAGTPVVSATKGIETESLRLMHEVDRQTRFPGSPFVALSGPSFAEEVAEGQPTAVVAAARDAAVAAAVQQVFVDVAVPGLLAR